MIITFGLSGLAAACLFAGLAKAPVNQLYMAENGCGLCKASQGSPAQPEYLLPLEFSSSFSGDRGCYTLQTWWLSSSRRS